MKYQIGHMDPWWEDQYIGLDYQYEPYKDNAQLELWHQQGYGRCNLQGALYRPTRDDPHWIQRFYNTFDWQDITVSFFRMNTTDLLPAHRDHFTRYKQIHNINDSTKIWRAVIFLEDWKSGHYFDIDGDPIVGWTAGDWVQWNNDVEHFAGNIGIQSRYTVQITGHEKPN